MTEGTGEAAKRLPSRQTFQKTALLLDDFFKVDEYRGGFEKYDNTMSEEQRLLVFERGDAVAALLFDRISREVVLVEQFRLPTVEKGLGKGWIVEPAAGMVRPGETPTRSINRELWEETGFRITDLEKIATFFVSPGGSTEQIHLFYAEVIATQQETEGGGIRGDGEDIRLVRMPITEFFAKLANNGFEDAKLIIAAQWLKDRLSRQSHEAKAADPVERKVRLDPVAGRFSRPVKPQKYVGYFAGDIMNVKGVEVWVNPLDTDMILDRFSDPTVSARIRRGGAKPTPDGRRIERDIIAEELSDAMRGRQYVHPAQVVLTRPGRLAETNGVKCIAHVATSKGEIGAEQSIAADTLDQCVENVLIEAARKRYSSVLIPTIGTGAAGFSLREVAPRLLSAAVRFLKEYPRSSVTRVYFLPYSEVDVTVFEAAMKGLDDRLEPEKS